MFLIQPRTSRARACALGKEGAPDEFLFGVDSTQPDCCDLFALVLHVSDAYDFRKRVPRNNPENAEESEVRSEGCCWCGAEHMCLTGRGQGLCSTCFGIAANQRRLSKLIREKSITQQDAHPRSEDLQYRYRLAYYEERELHRKALGERQRNLISNPDGISVEYLLGNVAELAGCPRNLRLLHGYANVFAHGFTAEQRKLLLRMVMYIVRHENRNSQVRWARDHAARRSSIPQVVPAGGCESSRTLS